jgi:hypothetical protein
MMGCSLSFGWARSGERGCADIGDFPVVIQEQDAVPQGDSVSASSVPVVTVQRSESVIKAKYEALVEFSRRHGIE